MLIKTKYFFIVSLLISLILMAAQCGTQPAAGQPTAQAGEAAAVPLQPELNLAQLAPVSLADGEKLRVVATTSIIGDLVSNVGADLVDLTVLVPLGSDPHTFRPAPQDAAAIARAHLVFMNGLGLEEFMTELIDNAGGAAIVVPVSSGLEPRQLKEDANQTQDHHHQGTDPHLWTSPANAMIMVHNIEQTLSALDPAHASAYQANAKTYTTKLQDLDQWVKSQIETIPAANRKLVTDHDDFGYYADRYGLELIGAVIPAYSTNAEPSAQELAQLQDAIKEFGVKAVFVGTTVNPALAQRVAEDTGIQLVSLYTGSLGKAGSGAETYLDYIRYDTNAIVKALE